MKIIFTLLCFLSFFSCSTEKEEKNNQKVDVVETIESTSYEIENQRVLEEKHSEKILLRVENYVPPTSDETVVIEPEGQAERIYAEKGVTKRLLATVPEYETLSAGYSPIRDRVLFWRPDYTLTPEYGNVFYFEIGTGEFIDTGLSSYVWYTDKENRYLLVTNDTDDIPQWQKDAVTQEFGLTSFPLIPKLYDLEKNEFVSMNFDFVKYVLEQEAPAMLTLALEYNRDLNAFNIMYFLGNRGQIMDGYFYLDTMNFEIK